MKEKPEEKTIIRAELNLEKWPIFSTSPYKGKSKEIVRTVKLANGDIETRKVIIGKINDVEVGVFRIFDFKGFCALIKIWEEQGRPADKNAMFSVHHIAEILNLSWGGKTYTEIKRMLNRLRKIPIDWINSFYNREQKETESLIESFTILSDLKIFEKTKNSGKQMALPFSSFSFDKRLVGNLLNNYSKPLLLNYILQFKKETAILLYRYVDLMMADKTHYERNTKDLLSELDLSQDGYPYPAQRKKLFEPVMKELTGVYISTGKIVKAELVKNKKDSDWKVVFDKEKAEPIQAILEAKKDAHKDDSLSALIKRGITKTVAEDLVARFPDELIKEKIETFDLLIGGGSNLVKRNPPGWLRSAIEQNYSAPKGLETKEQKRKKEEANQERVQKQEIVTKIEQYRSWLKSKPETQIWWGLEKWKKQYKEEHQEGPTVEQVRAKQKELIAKLPTNEETQIQIFGKVMYKEDGSPIEEPDKSSR